MSSPPRCRTQRMMPDQRTTVSTKPLIFLMSSAGLPFWSLRQSSKSSTSLYIPTSPTKSGSLSSLGLLYQRTRPRTSSIATWPINSPQWILPMWFEISSASFPPASLRNMVSSARSRPPSCLTCLKKPGGRQTAPGSRPAGFRNVRCSSVSRSMMPRSSFSTSPSPARTRSHGVSGVGLNRLSRWYTFSSVEYVHANCVFARRSKRPFSRARPTRIFATNWRRLRARMRRAGLGIASRRRRA